MPFRDTCMVPRNGIPGLGAAACHSAIHAWYPGMVFRDLELRHAIPRYMHGTPEWYSGTWSCGMPFRDTCMVPRNGIPGLGAAAYHSAIHAWYPGMVCRDLEMRHAIPRYMHGTPEWYSGIWSCGMPFRDTCMVPRNGIPGLGAAACHSAIHFYDNCRK
jgi:hypothetical protein